MTKAQAIDYINSAVSEGYMDESIGDVFLNLPEEQMIIEVEKLANRGDATVEEPF